MNFEITSIEQVCRSVKGCGKSFVMKWFLPAAQRLGQVEGFVGSSSWEDDFLGKIRCTSSWEDNFLFFSFGQYFK